MKDKENIKYIQYYVNITKNNTKIYYILRVLSLAIK